MKFKEYKTKELVMQVLKEFPEARENDMTLILETWKKQGLKLQPGQEGFIYLCIPLETITRMKRHLRKSNYIHVEKIKEETFVHVPKV